MASKTKGYFIIAATLTPFPLSALLILSNVQGLPRARVGVVARVDPAIAEPVTLTIALPRYYGLTASEQQAGWDELNDPAEARAVLGNAPAQVSLPPISYCTHYPAWGYPPPPPARFTLRLSDAPDEIYTVWRTSDDTAYSVHDSSGQEIPNEIAVWKLSGGAYSSPDPPGTRERLWLLELTLERQHRPSRIALDQAA